MPDSVVVQVFGTLAATLLGVLLMERRTRRTADPQARRSNRSATAVVAIVGLALAGVAGLAVDARLAAALASAASATVCLLAGVWMLEPTRLRSRHHKLYSAAAIGAGVAFGLLTALILFA
jgi:cytochrome bd-type quinol oxidase subunit 2